MDKEDTPPTQPAGDDGNFTYERDAHGNLLVDGVEVDRDVNPLLLTDPEPAPAEDEEEQEPEPEKAAESPAPAAAAKEEPAKEETQRETPGKQKFKLKVYGEELEKEFDQNELVATLQKGMASEKRFQEVAAKEREVEPFQHIVKSAKFKEWLDAQVQAGEIEAPAPPPKPEPEDIMGYRLRAKDPDFNVIREAMAEWAVTLPQYEASQLESNHRVFNMAYDRFKTAQSQNKPAAPPEKVVATKEVAEAVLAAKEQRKDTARSERAGLHTEADPNRAKQQKLAQLTKRSRQGDLNASIELARMLYADDLTG